MEVISAVWAHSLYRDILPKEIFNPPHIGDEAIGVTLRPTTGVHGVGLGAEAMVKGRKGTKAAVKMQMNGTRVIEDPPGGL